MNKNRNRNRNTRVASQEVYFNSMKFQYSFLNLHLQPVSNELVEIDIHGEIKFGEYDKISRVTKNHNFTHKIHLALFKYVKIKHNSSINDMFKISQDKNVFSVSKLEMNIPKLCISITGGAQNFQIPQNIKNAFKLGLIKAATSTNTLIITGGTNTGVMKLVGEAIVESVVDLSKVTVLGIATWGVIADRETLLVFFILIFIFHF